jgi:hypothetical protein
MDTEKKKKKRRAPAELSKCLSRLATKSVLADHDRQANVRALFFCLPVLLYVRLLSVVVSPEESHKIGAKDQKRRSEITTETSVIHAMKSSMH